MIGKTISHYKILSEIGSGGMGIVYKAEDINLKRHVALKFLPPELTRDTEARERFIHEAQSASALDHPNVCTVYEIGKTDDNQMFIAMGYYEGETLKDRIAKGPLKIDEALDIAIQISSGLEKAHKKDICHRDIKPANIFITNDNVVKILDFGLAKLSGQTKLTKDGSTLGTVAYMSPEQTTGEKTDSRSDIWSLGVVLFEMITGLLPFKGDYEQAMQYSIINEEPEPITGLRTGIPLELERIVNRTLAKDPQDRYQHADDLLSELNRLKRDSDSDKIPIKSTSKKMKKNIVIIPAIILSTVVLIIAGYLLLKPSLSEKEELPASRWENSIAVLPFADLSPEEDQEWFCDGMTEQIITNLSKIKRLMVIGRTSVMQFKDTKKTLPEIGEELNVSHILEGSIRKYGNSIRVTAKLINTKDGSHLWADDFDRKLEHVFEVQDDVSQAIVTNLLATLSTEEKENIKTNRPSNPEAYENYLKGLHYLHTDEENDLLRSVDYFIRAIELAPTYAIAYTELANAYQRLTGLTYMSLDEGYPKALAAVERALDLEPELNEAHLALARIKFILEWDWEGAEKEFLKVLKLNPNSAKGHERYGVYLVMMGRFEKATQEILLARELEPLSAWINNNVGWIYYYQRQYEKALSAYQKNLEMYPGFSMSYREQAVVYMCYGMPDDAITSAQKAVTISDNDILNISNLGLIYAMAGEREKANVIIQQLLERSETKPIPLYDLSMMFGALGDNDQAFKYLEEAYEKKSNWAFEINVDPVADNLRLDPRYAPLIRKMGLEP